MRNRVRDRTQHPRTLVRGRSRSPRTNVRRGAIAAEQRRWQKMQQRPLPPSNEMFDRAFLDVPLCAANVEKDEVTSVITSGKLLFPPLRSSCFRR